MLAAATPDPAPGSGGTPIVYVAYDYTVSARNKLTGALIPGLYFHCHVAASGQRHCVLLKSAEVLR
jgi:hypothetical protein